MISPKMPPLFDLAGSFDDKAFSIDQACRFLKMADTTDCMVFTRRAGIHLMLREFGEMTNFGTFFAKKGMLATVAYYSICLYAPAKTSRIGLWRPWIGELFFFLNKPY